MKPNHQQLLGFLESAEPGFVAGTFATVFPHEEDPSGETGSFRYFAENFWCIRFDDGARFLLAPWGSTVIEADGTADHGPAMLNRPRRPPWSMVLPRCSTFLGRPDDDWQVSASKPITENGRLVTVALTNLEQPQFTGTMTVDPRHWIITEVRLGHMIQSLHIERTQPDADDHVVLEDIKASVRPVSG